MHKLQQNQTSTPQSTSSISTASARGHIADGHPVSPLSHRGIHRVQRSSQPGSLNRLGGAPPALSQSLRKDFAQIPLHSESNSGIQVSTPGDKFEQEANAVAEQVVKTPDTQKRSSALYGRGGFLDANSGKENITLQTMPEMSGRESNKASPAFVQNALHSPGKALDGDTRTFMESRFGYDFSRVRVHTGPEAQTAAEHMNAKAFTLGNHIVFADGHFNPRTEPGKNLIAHELTHTIQQHKANNPLLNTIQRQNNPQSKPKSAPTLKDLIPFKQGDRVTFNHLITNDIIDAIKAFAPGKIDLDAILPLISERTATIDTLTDNQVVIVVDKKTQAAKTAKGGLAVNGTFTIELTRDPKQNDISVSLYSGSGKQKKLLNSRGGIKLSSGNPGTNLSTSIGGFNLNLDVTPGNSGNDITVALSGILSTELLRITRLPNVRQGTAEEKQAVEKAAQSAKASRATKPYSVSGELGGYFPEKGSSSFLLGTSFQVNFRPVKGVGMFFQVPLELQLQYAPPASMLAAVSSGAVLSLGDIAPVNIRLIAGVGGGAMKNEKSGDYSAVFGPVVGAGVNYQVIDAFSIGLRYQDLINLVGEGGQQHAFTLGVSGYFGSTE